MKPPQPVFLAPKLVQLDELLVGLLSQLSPDQWQAPTLAPGWRVHDVAAHLLDGNLRSLSMLRDGYFGESPGEINEYADLVVFLNRLNADWVKAMRRLSPSLLVELLRISGKAYCEHLASLDPFAPAAFSVAWAGETTSLNWFHIAREYTEKWHHQQQIREAVGGESPLLASEFMIPFLDTSMRALPHHYRHVEGQEGDVIRFEITGKALFSCDLAWEEGKWKLSQANEQSPATLVEVPDSVAWRMFTKGVTRPEALLAARVEGNAILAEPFFSMLAIMG